MYRGWKSAGCRGWPVPKRGFCYGSIITAGQRHPRDIAEVMCVVESNGQLKLNFNKN